MSRFVIFAYGAAVYAFFFATFCYVIGFVTGLVVPKTINSGEVVEFWPSLLINASFLGAFAIQHIIMARPKFKQWWTTIIPKAAERSTFVLFATAILALMCWQWRPMPEIIWEVQTPVLRTILTGISLLGFGIVLYSSFLINHFDLFGLRQVVLALKGKPYTQLRFVERSLYKLVRHPLMVGFLIAFWSAPTMTAGHLLFALLTTGYIFVGLQLEERDLIAAHGEDYLAYKRRAYGLLPIPKRRAAATPAPVSAT